jgi:hypothetical protein
MRLGCESLVKIFSTKKHKKGTPQYKTQKALKTRRFQSFLAFILRGPLFRL